MTRRRRSTGSLRRLGRRLLAGKPEAALGALARAGRRRSPARRTLQVAALGIEGLLDGAHVAARLVRGDQVGERLRARGAGRSRGR